MWWDHIDETTWDPKKACDLLVRYEDGVGGEERDGGAGRVGGGAPASCRGQSPALR